MYIKCLAREGLSSGFLARLYEQTTQNLSSSLAGTLIFVGISLAKYVLISNVIPVPTQNFCWLAKRLR